MNIIQSIKDYLAQRGGQIVTQVALKGIIALVTYLGIKMDGQVEQQAAVFCGGAAIGGILFVIDLWSHGKQQTALVNDVTGHVADAMVNKIEAKSIERPQTPVTIHAIIAANEIKRDTQILCKLPPKT